MWLPGNSYACDNTLEGTLRYGYHITGHQQDIGRHIPIFQNILQANIVCSGTPLLCSAVQFGTIAVRVQTDTCLLYTSDAADDLQPV